MWIATDGQDSSLRKNDAVFAVPTQGPERRAALRPHLYPRQQKLLRGQDFILGLLRECPHNGCKVRVHPSEQTLLICYCHGSLFRRTDGCLEAGVANQDLPGLQLELEGEHIVVVGLAEP